MSRTTKAYLDCRPSDEEITDMATWPTSGAHDNIEGNLPLDYYQGFLRAWSLALLVCEKSLTSNERIAMTRQACAGTARLLQARRTAMGPLQVAWETLDISAPARTALKSSWAEVLRCLEAGCYGAAVGVCGKVVEETLLYAHSVHLPGQSAKAILAKQGINALWTPLRKLRRFEKIKWAVDVISEYRNASVHAGRAFLASRENGTAVAALTKDLLLKVWTPGGLGED